MSNLRDLLLITPPSAPVYKQQQLAIFNGREGTGVTDGGKCCCWIVPGGTTWATVEVWGGGGDGGGGCCCMGQYKSPGSGQYAKKTIAVNTLAYLNICVAGSGCCSCGCCGTCGFPSFATNPAGSVFVCGPGGMGGCEVCGHMGGLSCTGICQTACMCGCQGLGDFAAPVWNISDHQNNFCVNGNYQMALQAFKYQPNLRKSFDPCVTSMAISGCNVWQSMMTTWPGGPGAGGQGCGGGCCWGGWGTSGLAIITYG